MKTSLFKKLIAITLSLTLVMSCMMIAMPQTHAVDVTYAYDNDGKKVGITGIVIDNVNYYDIYGGNNVSSVDDYGDNEVDFYLKALTTKNESGLSVAEHWGRIATSVFEQAGQGWGYSGNLNNGFDFQYNHSSLYGNMNNGLRINLPLALAYDGEKMDINESGDQVTFSGLTYASSLSAAQTMMARRLADAAYLDGEVMNKEEAKDIVAKDILERCADDSTSIFASDDAPGYKLMNDETEQTVITSIVTVHDVNSWVSSFGLAFYDFELVPIMNEEIKMITAADGFDSLEEAAANEIPGVSYTTDGTEAPKMYYIENKTTSPASLSASYSETVATTVSNHMESTETFSYAENITSTTDFKHTFPFAEVTQSISVGFTAEQAFSTAYGSEESYTEENTTSSTVDVTLPAHTKLATSIQNGTTEMSVNYDCPVYITYKVMIFSMHSSTNDDIGAGGICTAFGTGSSIGGTNAIDNLYNRAVSKVNVNGYELAQGNYFAGKDEDRDDLGPFMEYEIHWNKIFEKEENSDDLTEKAQRVKESVENLNTYRPLSSTGGTMSIASTSMNTDVGSILPLYDLDYVQTDGSSVYTLALGGTLDFSKITTRGYNVEDVDYYGYISDGGSWVLSDENGNELTDVDGVSLTNVGNYQKLTADKVGTYYAKFKIDEDSYNKVDGSGKITNADLSSTAIVTINVTETGLDHICTEGPWETTITATCTAEGEQIAKCMSCGRVMYTQTVDKLDHIPVTLTTPATCTNEGSITKICGVCLGLISSETIAKLEHNEGVWKIDFEATADHHGQMSRYCTACGTSLESKEFELHIHEFGYESITREPTCVANGEKGLFCSICNAMYATEQIEKSGHGATVDVIAKDADCTHDGETHQYCTDCGELVGTNVIPALGHTAGAWETVIEATCEVNGEKHQSCSTCGELLNTDIIEAHGHAAAWITVKEADCKTTGREEYTCTICEAVLETRAIEKTEHVPGKWEITLQPTCTQSGLMQQVCAICGALIGEPVVIDAHDHDNGAWRTVLEATCTTDGEKVRECTICEGTIESEVIPALGHDDGVWTTALEATCETPGERHKNCTRCGQLIDSERIDALGHTPGPAMTCVTDQVCLVCEEVLVPADGKSHTWTDWETYKEASFFVEEQQRRVCTSCDLEEYRFVKGTSKCHKYFPHCGDGEDCWACNTLSNTNGFFRNLGKFLTWFFFENIITNILFPFAHGHFHELINLDEIFGS